MNNQVKPAFSEAEIRAKIESAPQWFHQIELAPGIVTPGRDNSASKLERLNIPADLAGKRVLDIGTNDGFFSFECERRGAHVIAIDEAPTPGFRVAHELLGSAVEFRRLNIYDLAPEELGTFDIVLCLGVLYHLRHPLLALERVHTICTDLLILETQVCDRYFMDASGDRRELALIAPELLATPIAQFYTSNELNGDVTNWWSPNIMALHGMLQSTGFVPQQTISVVGRACVHCSRVEPPAKAGWLGMIAQASADRAANGTLEGNPSAVSTATTSSAPQAAFSEHVLAQSLGQVVVMQSQQNQHLHQILAQRDARIADLEKRAHWLAEQSRAARHALAAVEQGRVLRLLRWLSRMK
jgi:tRNA (mo5U34)-methyltransferase